MRFQPLTLAAAPIAAEHFKLLRTCTCDYTVCGMFMWREFYKMEYAVEAGAFYTRLTDDAGMRYYSLPAAANVKAAIEHLLQEESAQTVRFCTIPAPELSLFSACGTALKVEPQTDYFDYLYRAEDLVSLSGKKYSGQRNHIHQFLRNNPDWRFAPITEENAEDAIAFFKSFYTAEAVGSGTAAEENRKTLEVLQNMRIYGVVGGILYASGRVVGFSLGEILRDVLYIHIEKADRSCKGANQMLTNQFAKHFAAEGVNYINREEDMGDEGLRRSKLSYHPVALLEKYTVEMPLSVNIPQNGGEKELSYR